MGIPTALTLLLFLLLRRGAHGIPRGAYGGVQQQQMPARVWERLEPDGNEPPLIVVGPTGGAHALNALVALVMLPHMNAPVLRVKSGPYACQAYRVAIYSILTVDTAVQSLTGRHHFIKGKYRCSACKQVKQQGARELLQAGLYAATNSSQTQTYHHKSVLSLARKVKSRLPGSSTAGICRVLEDFSADHGGVGIPLAWRMAAPSGNLFASISGMSTEAAACRAPGGT